MRRSVNPVVKIARYGDGAVRVKTARSIVVYSFEEANALGLARKPKGKPNMTSKKLRDLTMDLDTEGEGQ